MNDGSIDNNGDRTTSNSDKRRLMLHACTGGMAEDSACQIHTVVADTANSIVYIGGIYYSQERTKYCSLTAIDASDHT